MASRGRAHGERTARQVRQEHVQRGSPRADPATGRVPANDAPPSWLVKGARVHFAGAEKTRLASPQEPARDCTVIERPFRVGKARVWCTLLDKVRGWVRCDALTQVEGN